jgi:cell division transport system ATP-binding protein
MFELFHAGVQYAELPALSDVTLRIAPGDFIVLCGASGAGKSTLLRLLFADATVTSGQVLFRSRHVARMTSAAVSQLRRSVSVVFQDFKLLGDMTVVDNVALALEVRGVSGKDATRRAMNALADVGLLHKARHAPAELSGGEQQFLLCDEPTGNLDDARATEIAALLSAAHTRGTAVVIATHEPRRFAGVTRRLLVLDRGRVVHDVPGFAASDVVLG